MLVDDSVAWMLGGDSENKVICMSAERKLSGYQYDHDLRSYVNLESSAANDYH